MWWLREFLKNFTPAGIKHFILAHRYSLAISLAMTLLGFGLFVAINFSKSGRAMLRLVDQVEARTLDMRFHLRGPRTVDNRIVIVAIDQHTVNRLGWPFPRSWHARVVERLHKDGARAIGFDVAFPFPDPNSPTNFAQRIGDEATRLGQKPDPALLDRVKEIAEKVDSDRQFAQAMEKADNVVLGHSVFLEPSAQASLDPKRVQEYNEVLAFQAYPQIRKIPAGARFAYYVEDPRAPSSQFDVQGIEPNLRIFADAAKAAGFFDFVPDSDGVFRRAPLIIRHPERVKTQLEENFYPSLSIQVLIQYLKAGPQDVIFFFNENGPDHLEIAQYKIVPDLSGQVLLNFADPDRAYAHYSFSAVAEGVTPPGTFQDKIVLIGATAVGIGDVRNMPYGTYPGVEIHANLLDNILQNNFIKRAFREEMTDLGILVICGLVSGLVFVTMKPSYSWAFLMLAAAGLFGFVYVEFKAGRWLSLVIPSATLLANYVGVTSYRMIFEEREKRKVRGAFGMYVHPGLVEQMMKNPDLLRLGGEEVELTVMFSDVRGFTSISEKLTPTELVHLLNEYLTAMSDVIMANWGTVDKYEGDAIMAFWGRPYPQPDHASRACKSCLLMLDRLAELNRNWEREGKQTLNIGIGINTGPMVVGNMGSKKRFNYTVMGDAVNLGSRLEGQNKEYATHLIISQSTYEQVAEEFVCRELDLIRVKGKLKPVAIYELMAPGSERNKYEPLLNVFAQGLAAYREGRFEEALRVFEQILSAYPEDGPTKLFAKRCGLYVASPPPAWDGVFVATTK